MDGAAEREIACCAKMNFARSQGSSLGVSAATTISDLEATKIKIGKQRRLISHATLWLLSVVHKFIPPAHRHRGRHQNVSQGVCYVAGTSCRCVLQALQEPSARRRRAVSNVLSAVRNCLRY